MARPGTPVLREGVRLLPDVLRLTRRLAADRTLPRGVRVWLWLLLGWLLNPLDPVPDVIPVLGWADDVIVTVLVLRGVARRAGPDAVAGHWPGTPDGLAALWRVCRLPGQPPERGAISPADSDQEGGLPGHPPSPSS
jgi:uncharacterized membrane protein YkvA (DUF1232 family)